TSTWPFEVCDSDDATCKPAGTMSVKHLVEIAQWAHDPAKNADPFQVALIDILVQVCMLHGAGPYLPPVTGSTPHWKAVHEAWSVAKTATTPKEWQRVIEELTHGA
ncbi:MAG: hypothetical protein ACYTGK_17270, partial [Planctomycetota bacterium]